MANPWFHQQPGREEERVQPGVMQVTHARSTGARGKQEETPRATTKKGGTPTPPLTTHAPWPHPPRKAGLANDDEERAPPLRAQSFPPGAQEAHSPHPKPRRALGTPTNPMTSLRHGGCPPPQKGWGRKTLHAFAGVRRRRSSRFFIKKRAEIGGGMSDVHPCMKKMFKIECCIQNPASQPEQTLMR